MFARAYSLEFISHDDFKYTRELFICRVLTPATWKV